MSLSWQSIKSDLRSNFVTLATAPVLCVIAVLLLAYIYGIEKDSREQIIDTKLITISADNSTQDDSEPKADELQLEEELARAEKFDVKLTELLSASEKDNFSLTQWLRISKREMNPKDYQDFLIYVARKTTQQEEYTLANEIFAEIGRKYFSDNLTGFYRAYALDKVDNYRLAKQTYEWQLERHPNHQSSAMNYGLLLLKNEQADSAIQALQHAISITSGQRKAKSLRFLSRAYLLNKQYEKAAETIRQSILFEPDNSQGWSFLGVALAHAEPAKTEEIIDAHQKAIALSPKNSRPYLALANYLFSQLRFQQANINYSKVNELNKNRIDAQILLGLSKYVSGRPFSANEQLKSIDDANTEQQDIIDILLLIIEKDYIQAKEFLAKHKDKYHKDNKNLILYLNSLAQNDNKNLKIEQSDMFYWPQQLARVSQLLDSDEKTKSLEASEKLKTALPQSAEALLIHARSLLKNDRKDEALSVFQKAHEIEPSSRRIAISYAELLHKNGQLDLAVNVLDTLLSLQSRYTRALMLKAKLLIEKSDYKPAKQVLQKVINMDEKNIQAAYQLALLQNTTGDDKSALATLDELLSIQTANIPARLLKANILAKNQRSESLKELERILKLEQENVQALELKNKLLESVAKKT